MKTVLTLTAMLVLGCQLRAQVSFTLSSTPSVGTHPQSVTTADVNGDGKADLICANQGANTLSVLTNNGSGGVATAGTYAVGSNPLAVTAADVNGDGHPDLICANYGNNNLSVLTNNGSGGFVAAGTYAVGGHPYSVATADVNGDGKVDLICANSLGDTISVLTNNGSGGFVTAGTYPVGSNPISVTVADVNGDGKPDFISANFYANTLSVYTNNGSGGFVLAGIIAASGPYSVTAADVNGDGKPDLICANYYNNSVTVLTNNGSGGFTLDGAYGVGNGPQWVTTSDVNGDGQPDLISANTTDSTLSVLTNNGVGGFVMACTYAVGNGPGSIMAADVNGDGKPDLISGNFYANTLSLLTNGTPFPPSPCVPPPSGLVGWWPGEGNANDVVGGNNGTLEGGTTFAPGMVGQGFRLDGTSGFVQIPDSSSLKPAKVTVEAWVWLDPNITTPRVEFIIFKKNSWDYLFEGYSLLKQPLPNGDGTYTDRFSFVVTSGGNQVITYSKTVVQRGVWYHVAGTYDSNQLTLWVNGVAEASAIAGFALDYGTRPVFIGTSGQPEPYNGKLAGIIDEASIYSRALSANEMAAIYNAGSKGKCPPGSTPPTLSGELLNVDFGGAGGRGYSLKTGFAAVGIANNDFWNFYDRDRSPTPYDWRTSGTLTNLQSASHTTTTVGMTVSDAPGAWGNGSSDPMYATYDYPLDGGNNVVTFTNLPAGQYDVLAYSGDGNYEVTVGGTSYGVKTTFDSPLTNPPAWMEGVQYARWRNVLVAAGQPLVLTVRNGVGGWAVLSGVQILNDKPASPGCTPAPTGLISWWPAEGNPNDVVGSNNGIAQNINYTNGEVGQAFVFDGSTSEIRFPANPSLDVGLGDGFTVEVWVNPANLNLQELCEWNQNNGIPYGAGQIGTHMEINESPGDGSFWGNIVDTTGISHNFHSAAGLITTHSFQHLAMTYDKTSGVGVLYYNGAPVATANLGVFTPQTSFDFFLGNRPSGYFTGIHFQGEMDEPAVYNRALSASEIAAIYNAGSKGKCPPGSTPPTLSGQLINVDFGGAGGRGYSLKIGLAAVGIANNDFWNFYDRDRSPTPYDWRTSGTLTNLQSASHTTTTVGMTVSDAPGAWGNGSSDPMYATYDYPLDGGNNVVTFTNLPAGQYDVLAYSGDGNYEVTVGGTSYGVKTTFDSPLTNPPAWREGVQYARWRNVLVAAGQPLVLTVRNGVGGWAVLSGVQILNDKPASPDCTTAPTGLMGWWKGEGNGNDNAGENNAVAPTGVSYASAEVGQGFGLDGQAHQIFVPDAPVLNFGSNQDFSLEVWIQPLTNPGNWQDVMSIVDKRIAPDTITQLGYELNLQGGVVTFQMADVLAPFSWNNFTAGPDLRDGKFHHVAVTVRRNSTSGGQIYIDGQVALTFDPTVCPGDLSNTGPFRIGNHATPGLQAYYHGIIDEVSLYNRALSANEVTAIFQAGSAGKCLPPPIPPTITMQPTNRLATVGDNVSFSVTASGTMPLNYQWSLNTININHATNATLILDNVQLSNAGYYSVTVTNLYGSATSSNALLKVNQPPVADATATVSPVISVNNSNATVVLNGSLSYDPDGDSIQYAWYQTGAPNPFATGIIAVVVLPVGTNSITLTVSDGLAARQQTITVQVITLAQAVEQLQAVVNTDVSKAQPLIATLNAALGSIDRSNPIAAINQLQAFQNQISAQISPLDPALAQTLIDEAQSIINALSGTAGSHKALQATANGKMHLNFPGIHKQTYIIEASTNLLDWEMIGVANDQGDGTFNFDDADAPRIPQRYYRIIVP